MYFLRSWGYTNPFRVGAPPNDLQRAFLPTITNPECRESGLNVTNTEVCTYSRFLQGACGVSFKWWTQKNLITISCDEYLIEFRVIRVVHWQSMMVKKLSESFRMAQLFVQWGDQMLTHVFQSLLHGLRKTVQTNYV